MDTTQAGVLQWLAASLVFCIGWGLGYMRGLAAGNKLLRNAERLHVEASRHFDTQRRRFED